MTRRVALTGATGFLGGAVARALLRRGASVRALVRPGRRPPAGLEVVEGALDDPAALFRLCDGAEVVVHVAGAVKALSRREFEFVNAECAAAVALAAGDARFVLVSSLAAREPGLSPYAASKRLGEVVVGRVIPPPKLTILRPTAIYGPGDREWLPMFTRLAAGRSLPDFSAPDARLTLMHVDDVAEAIAAMALDNSGPGTWALCDDRPEGYAWREVYEAAAEAVGRLPARVRQVPGGALRAAGAVSEAAAMLTRRPALLSRGKAREALHRDWSVAVTERLPLATPRHDLGSGFSHTVAWYRRHGWLAA